MTLVHQSLVQTIFHRTFLTKKNNKLRDALWIIFTRAFKENVIQKFFFEVIYILSFFKLLVYRKVKLCKTFFEIYSDLRTQPGICAYSLIYKIGGTCFVCSFFLNRRPILGQKILLRLLLCNILFFFFCWSKKDC